MKTKVIMNEEEWEHYKRLFHVGSMMHGPMVPPSYPVLVISNLVGSDYRPVEQVEHHFIEQTDMKKLLGIA